MAKRNEKGSLFLLAALAAAIAVLASQVKPAVAVGYTDGDDIATIVHAEVMKAKAKAPGLVRLVFHDCFVRGCDGSVLLTKTPYNAPGKTEQNSSRNDGLRGLEVIDAIRTRLTAEKGIKISCADAIVFAAREATNILSNGKIKYAVDGPGRKDGVVSSADDATKFLPGSTFTFDQLVKNYAVKKFDLTELVILSGAHSIGQSHRASFQDRLSMDVVRRNEIDFKYQRAIDKQSKAGPVKNNVRDMEFGVLDLSKPDYKATPEIEAAKGVLDNSYYYADLQNMVLFESDWVLRTDPTASGLLDLYKRDPNLWDNVFGAAMTKLSNSLESEGTLFEDGYRKVCSATNKNSYP